MISRLEQDTIGGGCEGMLLGDYEEAEYCNNYIYH